MQLDPSFEFIFDDGHSQSVKLSGEIMSPFAAPSAIRIQREIAEGSRWRDPECSYTRTLRYNPASERYEMDRVAPDCSSYTVP